MTLDTVDMIFNFPNQTEEMLAADIKIIKEVKVNQITYYPLMVPKSKKKEIAEKIFNTKFNYRKWRRICKKAGLSNLEFHDLRKTFCSLLAQNGVSTAVTQRLLDHSSPNLTNKVYTNVDPVLRQSVELLPIRNWL